MKLISKKMLSFILTFALVFSIVAIPTSAMADDYKLTIDETTFENSDSDKVYETKKISDKKAFDGVEEYEYETDGKFGTYLLGIEGELVPFEKQKVWTLSELFENFDERAGYFTARRTTGSGSFNTVLGFELEDLFTKSGVNESDIEDSYLIYTDGSFTQHIGPGLQFTGQGGVTDTGTISTERFRYKKGDFNFMVNAELDESLVGIPAKAMLAFSFLDARSNNGYPIRDDSSYAESDFTKQKGKVLRPFMGQRNNIDQTSPFSVDNTRLIMLNETDQTFADFKSENKDFTINGVDYTRMEIMMGTYYAKGAKVVGSFDNNIDNTKTYISGNRVDTMLPANTGDSSSVSFTLADGTTTDESITVGDLKAKDYLFVWEEGTTEVSKENVKNTVGDTTAYFNVYRDGNAIIENVVGMNISDLEPPVISPDNTLNIVGEDIEPFFANNAAYRDAVNGVYVGESANIKDECTVASNKITIPAKYFTETGEYTIKITADNYLDATVEQTIAKEPAEITADAENNFFNYGKTAEGPVNGKIEIAFEDNTWASKVNAVAIGTTVANAVTIDNSLWEISDGKIAITDSGTYFKSKTNYQIVVSAEGYANASVQQSFLYVTPELQADTDNNVIGEPISISFEPDNSNWRNYSLYLSVNGDTASSANMTKAANLITINPERLGDTPGDYVLTFTHSSAGNYLPVNIVQTILPTVKSDEVNNTVPSSEDVVVEFSHVIDWSDDVSVKLTAPGEEQILVDSEKFTATSENLTLDKSLFTKAGEYVIRVETTKGSILFTQVIDQAYEVDFELIPTDATVTVKDSEDKEVDAIEGKYYLKSGTYNYEVTSSGYVTQTDSFTVEEAAKTIEVRLVKEPSKGGGISDVKPTETDITETVSSSGVATIKSADAKDAKTITINGRAINDNATLVFDSRAVQAIQESGSDDIEFRISKEDQSVLSDKQKEELTDLIKQDNVQNKSVYSFSVLRNGKKVSDFKNGIVDISIDYKLDANEDPEKIIVFHLKDDGTINVIRDCRYNASTGKVSFKVNGFSYFIIGSSDDLTAAFTDVNVGDWFHDSVYYLASRNIVKGQTEKTFAPLSNITRAEFVQILYGIAAQDKQINDNSEITYLDVNSKEWYYNAIKWGTNAGVVQGANNKFRPNDMVTRQEMAVMLDKYIDNVAKISLDKAEAITFTDSGMIAGWAAPSVLTIQQAGIISGIANADGTFRFAPTANANRAEAAQMIATFVRKAY